MTPMNIAFSSMVKKTDHELVNILRQMGVDRYVYASKHLIERMVERNVDPVDVARLAVPVIKMYNETTYNEKTAVVFWKHLKLVASITLQPVTGTRRLVLKTIIDPEIKPGDFDVEFRI